MAIKGIKYSDAPSLYMYMSSQSLLGVPDCKHDADALLQQQNINMY